MITESLKKIIIEMYSSSDLICLFFNRDQDSISRAVKLLKYYKGFSFKNKQIPS